MALNVLLVVYAALAFVNVAFMAALLFYDRRNYYRDAITIWVGILLSFLADGFVSKNFGQLTHLYSIPFISFTMYGMASLASRIYEFTLPMRRLLLFSAGFWCVGAVCHYVFRASFTVSSFIICMGIVAPAVSVVVGLARLQVKLTFIDRCFWFVLVGEGLHIMDYPFLRNLEGAPVYGFSLGLFLIYFVSILVPVMINQRLGQDWNRNLEKKVKEGTNQLLAAEAKLIEAGKMASLGEMAGGIAHEINTPLAMISTTTAQMLELLREDPIDRTTLSEMAATAEQTTHRIAGIVQGLRTFSRDGSRDAFAKVNVSHLIESNFIFCRERFKSHGIELIADRISKDLSFEGRELEISQVILNLLNNAHDAIEKLKSPKWVKISAQDSSDWIEIRVTDSGNGIPLEIRENIFQPFFTTKEIGKGTGIGLSISSSIVQGHGGTLKLDTASSHTAFVIRLPKKQRERANLAA